MASFLDIHDKRHTVSITVATVKRLRDALNIDLMSILDPDSTLMADLSDPITLVDVLYIASGEQVSPDEFAQGLAGDALESATNALLGAIVDFFPGTKGRVLRKAMEKSAEVQTQMDAQIDQAVDKALSEFGESSISLAES